MIKPKFNNISNKCIDGNWISRSSAVEAFIFARADNINDDMLNILTIQRSSKMIDEPNKRAVPSGYIDWNENGYESMVRELYEETSLYLPDYEKYIIFNNHQQSFYTDTRITNNRQNIVLRYIIVMEFDKDADKFPLSIENYKDPEIDFVKWMDWFSFTTNELEWAFDHDDKISSANFYYMTGQYNIDYFNKRIYEKYGKF